MDKDSPRYLMLLASLSEMMETSMSDGKGAFSMKLIEQRPYFYITYTPTDKFKFHVECEDYRVRGAHKEAYINTAQELTDYIMKEGK